MDPDEASPAGRVDAWKKVDAEARDVLGAYAAQLDKLFARDLVGIYLYGSVSYGAFVPGTSDLDVAVLHRRDLDDARRIELEALHAQLRDLPRMCWLDVTFVPLRLVGGRGDASLPYLRDNRFQRTGGGDANKVMWRALRDRGVVVRGGPPAGFVPRVSREELKDEMRRNLSFLRRRMPAYVVSGTRDTVFGVLSLCRVLYTLRTGELTGKAAGARWALAHSDPRWRPVIRHSLLRYEENDFSTADARFKAHALDFAFGASKSVVHRVVRGRPSAV